MWIGCICCAWQHQQKRQWFRNYGRNLLVHWNCICCCYHSSSRLHVATIVSRAWAISQKTTTTTTTPEPNDAKIMARMIMMTKVPRAYSTFNFSTIFTRVRSIFPCPRIIKRVIRCVCVLFVRTAKCFWVVYAAAASFSFCHFHSCDGLYSFYLNCCKRKVIFCKLIAIILYIQIRCNLYSIRLFDFSASSEGGAAQESEREKKQIGIACSFCCSNSNSHSSARIRYIETILSPDCHIWFKRT